MRKIDVKHLFSAGKPVIGMVHVLPLPGAPAWAGSMDEVIDRALADTRALVTGGIDGIFIENYGDTPFFPERVPAETIAALSIVVREIARETALPKGVNVLRNDAAAALAIAVAADAQMIRVNVHTGTMHTDQGPISGRAHETVRARAALSANVAICADVMVKHATPPVGATYAQTAADTWERGAADVLIVSGRATGAPTEIDSVRQVRDAVPDATIWIGSGIDASNAAALLAVADGAIVGSALQRAGAGTEVETDRVRRLMDVVEKLR
jgi:membrane complex biogenesis BtpA family protein